MQRSALSLRISTSRCALMFSDCGSASLSAGAPDSAPLCRPGLLVLIFSSTLLSPCLVELVSSQCWLSILLCSVHSPGQEDGKIVIPSTLLFPE